MYSVVNNTAYINGSSGKFDGIIQNPSVRYGRNAIANHIGYLKDYRQDIVECEPYDENDSIEDYTAKIEKFIEALKTQKLPPINFETQYMPKSKPGCVDCDALLGASFEEMGQRYSVSVEDMNKKLNPEGQDIQINVSSLDLNHDKKIDIGEYASSILLADMLSSGSEKFDTNNINGKFNNKGENALLRYYSSKDSAQIQYSAYSYLYNFYNLNRAVKDFVQNPNNRVYVS